MASFYHAYYFFYVQLLKDNTTGKTVRSEALNVKIDATNSPTSTLTASTATVNVGGKVTLTAKATGKEVHAGPGEATAIGNITAQMLKAQEFKSIEEARTTIHESFGIKIYK